MNPCNRPAPATTQRSYLRPWLLGLALGLSGLTAAQAQSLLALYQTARSHDANLQSALAQTQAAQFRADQAQAGLRPQVGLNGNANWSVNDSSGRPTNTSNNQSLAVAASQPLYRPGNQIAIDQAQLAMRIAQSQLNSSEQALIVGLSQAYFDVLAAQDSLSFVQAQKAAVQEQLAAAKRNFEVGTSTITDTREAEARFDLVLAQEIAADNDLKVKRLALEQLVGQNNLSPLPLAQPAELPALQPAALDTWVEQAKREHPSLQQAQHALQLAQLDTRRAEAGLKPTLDLVGQYQIGRSPSALSGATSRSHNASVGVRFEMPLYSGNALQNRIKETVALEEKARADLQVASRQIAQATRSAYFGVVSGLGQVRALQAAERSSQSALAANQLGYQVGVRINIDVLNAQSQLFQTKRDLARARYDVLVGGLRLRQAAGQLQVTDLNSVDALLLR